MTIIPSGTSVSCPDVDTLLGELRRRRWAVHIFGLREAPELVGAVLRWNTCADVVLLRAEDDASAYRTPSVTDKDVFAPDLVVWQYHAAAAWTLRAVLTIEPPGTPGAPMAIEHPAGRCAVPQRLRRPMMIRPPRSNHRTPAQEVVDSRIQGTLNV